MSRSITLYALFVFAVGAVFYSYDFILQVSPSVMTQQLMDVFDANAAMLGSAAGLYYLSYTIMQVPAGLLIEQFRIRWVLFITIISCALGTVLYSAAPNIYVIGLGRLLMGGGSAFAFLSTLYLALQWLPTRLFPLFSGITQTLGSLGAAGGIAPLKHLTHAVGWRCAMLILGIFGLVLAVLSFITVTEKDPPKKGHLKKQCRQMMRNFLDTFKHPQTWPISLYGFCIWGPIVGFAALWGVKYLQTAYHLSSTTAGWGVTCIWLAMAVACPIFGWLSQHLRRRKLFLLILSAIGLISTLDLLLNIDQPIWLVFIALIGLGLAGSSQSLTFAVITDNQPSHLASAAHGFNNMMLVIGGFIFQTLIGLLLDLFNYPHPVHGGPIYTTHTFQLALAIMPILYIMAFCISLLFIRETFSSRHIKG